MCLVSSNRPRIEQDTGILARCSQEGHLSAVGYYSLAEGHQVGIARKTARSTLDGQTTH